MQPNYIFGWIALPLLACIGLGLTAKDNLSDRFSGSSSKQTIVKHNVWKHRAIDGDTSTVNMRIANMDAFEKDQLCKDAEGRCISCGKDAKHALKMLLKIAVSTEIVGRDKYGRPLAKIQTSKGDISKLMILNGYALPYNGSFQSDHHTAVSRLNGAMNYTWISPKEWRDGKRISCKKPAISGTL